MKHRIIVVFALAMVALLAGCQSSEKEDISSNAVSAAPAPPAKTAEEIQREENAAYYERWYKRNRAEAAPIIRKLGVGIPPKNFPATGNHYTWQENLALALKYADREPRSYNTEASFLRMADGFKCISDIRPAYEKSAKEILVAYGMFQMGNSPIHPRELRASTGSIFKKSVLREAAYRWMMPSVKRALSTMRTEDREGYLKILQHASDYAGSFDQARENAYWKSIGSCRTSQWQKQHYRLPKYVQEWSSYHCERLFTSFGPDGKENPYRKIEGFIFRRIEFDGWSRDAMKEMLDRAISDLAPTT